MAYNRRLSYSFRPNDTCYFEIYAPTRGRNFDLDAETDGTYYINVTIYQLNATVYLNNGTDFWSASDEVAVRYSPLGNKYQYKAKNNRIYLVTSGYGDYYPSTNVTLIMWKEMDAAKVEAYFNGNWTSVEEVNKAYIYQFHNDTLDNGTAIYNEYTGNLTYLRNGYWTYYKEMLLEKRMKLDQQEFWSTVSGVVTIYRKHAVYLYDLNRYKRDPK